MIQPMENERADAGRDGRICFPRPNFQALRGTGKKSFSLTTSRVGNNTQLIYTLLKVFCVFMCVFFALTDRVPTTYPVMEYAVANTTRTINTWPAGEQNVKRIIYKAPTRA